MSKRFGKKRVPECYCTYNFTCKACLTNAPLIAPAVFEREMIERQDAEDAARIEDAAWREEENEREARLDMNAIHPSNWS